MPCSVKWNLKEVEYFFSKKADTTVVTIEGYTLMHVTALNAHHEIVAYLLRKGILQMFAPPPLQHCAEGHCIPCPMFLVATCGHYKVYNVFMSRCKCSLEIESNALHASFDWTQSIPLFLQES